MTSHAYLVPWYINGQTHEDHDIGRRARRKDTLSAEDRGLPAS